MRTNMRVTIWGTSFQCPVICPVTAWFYVVHFDHSDTMIAVHLLVSVMYQCALPAVRVKVTRLAFYLRE
jgi:hypothetical protein